jgi:hypothetical protein
MKSEDLKNPKGLKSTQHEEESTKKAGANEELIKDAPSEIPEKEVNEVTPVTAGEKSDENDEPGKNSTQDEKINNPDLDRNLEDDNTEIQELNEPESENPLEPETEETATDSSSLNAENEEHDNTKEHDDAVSDDEDDVEKKSEPESEETLETFSEKNLMNEDEKEIPSDNVATVTSPEATKKEKPASKKEIKETEENGEPYQEEENSGYSSLSLIELISELTHILEKREDHNVKDDVEDLKTAFYKKVSEEAEEQKKQFIEEGGAEEDFQEQENPYEQDMKELLKRYRQVRHEFIKKLEHEKELNLQLKYNIIEEIKGLIHKEESINKTFQEFRELQQQWREIGLVPQTKMKDLWDLYHFHVENFYDYIKINQELRDLDLKKNLEVKIRLCEQAEELLVESNTIKAFNHLQKLHDRWREVGPVPRENKDDIWERFKAATAKINKKYQDFFETRKLEQKKNLDAKRALCEKVEEINEMEIDNHKEWSEKSKEVVNMQKVWRTIGFAPRKDNNKIYSRFREACDKFFDAKRDFYSKNKELQQNNLQMKIDLCNQAESLKESSDWRKATQDLINIQKQWKEIGPVPRKHSDVLWKRFRAACDYFFEKKSEHFSDIDAEQVENLNKKRKLIEEVENFKSTGDVDENLNRLKDFQRRWTEIGHVPIKKKDDVQKKFRDSIDKLFDELKLDDSKRNLLKFRTKMVSFSESSRGQNKMRMERDKYMSKLKQMESDLVLLDNNIGFFAKSKNAESLIEDVQRKIEQTKENIEILKNKIRVIDEMDSSEE